jgi:hypothetical protein
MQDDSEKFYFANKSDIEEIGAEQCGHDFWLTRNGHGTGFWDRFPKTDAHKRLDVAAMAFGKADLYLGDDGKVYLI